MRRKAKFLLTGVAAVIVGAAGLGYLAIGEKAQLPFEAALLQIVI